jgi:hypothetical protein
MTRKTRMKSIKGRAPVRERRGITLYRRRKIRTVFDTAHIPWLPWPTTTPAMPDQIQSR